MPSSILRAALFCSVILRLVQSGEGNRRRNFSHSHDEDEERHGTHSRRSYTMGPGKIMFCRSGPPGPPGPPGPQGMPGRDGRDGRDCPPCNCPGTVTTEIPPPNPSPCPTSSLPPIGPPAHVGPIHGHKRGEPAKKKAKNNSLCS